MTKIAKVSLVVLMGSSMLLGNQVKLYDVKSGKIDYEIKGSGEIMGQKMQTVGKKRVIFDNYGGQNLTEENKIEKQVIMGKANITKTHTMTYMKNAMTYTVSFDQKRITRMPNMSAMMGEQNMKQFGEEMMKQMGGKRIGTDKVLDYTCDVWELMGTQQCIYKGIPLKVVSDVMGIKNIEVATKAEFDISISGDDFKLPDFPIYDMEGNKLDRSKLDAMDKQSEVKLKKVAKEMAEMRESIDAAKKSAGIKDGEKITKAQEKKMEDAMMEAMWPQIKKKILTEGKILRFGRECLSDANTLKEANICVDKANAMGGEHEESFEEWSPASKKKMLGFMDQAIERLGCMEKANNMKEMQQCTPAQ